MKRIGAIAAILVLSGGLALAQSSGGAGGTGGTSASPGTSSTSPITPSPGTATPPGVTPSPSGSTTGSGSTLGQQPGINPSNPQDQTRRSNPQDLTLPGAQNPQDMKR